MLARDESGAVAVELVLIAAGIAVNAIAVVVGLGIDLSALF